MGRLLPEGAPYLRPYAAWQAAARVVRKTFVDLLAGEVSPCAYSGDIGSRPHLGPSPSGSDADPMKRLSLFSQILAINALLVTATVFVAAIAVDLSVGDAGRRREFAVLACALLVSLLANALLLRRRLGPLERLIRSMEEADLTSGSGRAQASRADAEEVVRRQASFNRMLDRLEADRRDGARNVLRAQEQERQRLAQDLHDEVNQALTAILLRLEASIQDAPPALRRELETTKELATQAMEELLHLARELRPTALDDHGLLPALRPQVSDFAERRGVNAEFRRR